MLAVANGTLWPLTPGIDGFVVVDLAVVKVHISTVDSHSTSIFRWSLISLQAVPWEPVAKQRRKFMGAGIDDEKASARRSMRGGL